MMPTEALPTSRSHLRNAPDEPFQGGLDVVLIRVPQVRDPKPSAPSGEAWPSGVRRAAPRSGRRRLKREVRIAGRILACLVVLAVLLNCGAVVLSAPRAAGGRPPRPHEAQSPTPDAPASPIEAPGRPRILLSVEPAGPAGDALDERPVVFPGYLLPDDSHEESVHEGS